GAKRIDPGEGGAPSRWGTRALINNAFPSSEHEPDRWSPLTRPQQAAVDLSPPGRGEVSALSGLLTRSNGEERRRAHRFKVLRDDASGERASDRNAGGPWPGRAGIAAGNA